MAVKTTIFPSFLVFPFECWLRSTASSWCGGLFPLTQTKNAQASWLSAVFLSVCICNRCSNLQRLGLKGKSLTSCERPQTKLGKIQSNTEITAHIHLYVKAFIVLPFQHICSVKWRCLSDQKGVGEEDSDAVCPFNKHFSRSVLPPLDLTWHNQATLGFLEEKTKKRLSPFCKSCEERCVLAKTNNDFFSVLIEQLSPNCLSDMPHL